MTEYCSEMPDPVAGNLSGRFENLDDSALERKIKMLQRSCRGGRQKREELGPILDAAKDELNRRKRNGPNEAVKEEVLRR